MNYYNEFDLAAAAQLQALIDAGLIPKGHIDTRSILQAAQGFPLAAKFPHWKEMLKGAGNAIVPQLAAEFIHAYDSP